MKKGRPPSEVSSQALLDIAKSISFNAKNYIPKDGASFSLFRIEILAGLTVALALVPEAIAFAFVAGVSTFIRSLCSFYSWINYSLIGGRPGMISGQQEHCSCYGCLSMRSWCTIFICNSSFNGNFTINCRCFKLGKFIRMVPQPVMLGFVNGLAIVIGFLNLVNLKQLILLVSQFGLQEIH